MATAVITGANRGLGLEMAKQYAAQGWDVIATAREPEKAEELNAIDKVTVMPLDAAEDSSIETFAEQLGGRPVDLFTSKAAVNQAWHSLAQQWQDEDLTLAMLHPGWVQTDMGGENADLTPQESVEGMRSVIEGLDRNKNGKFYDYSGREIPW